MAVNETDRLYPSVECYRGLYFKKATSAVIDNTKISSPVKCGCGRRMRTADADGRCGRRTADGGRRTADKKKIKIIKINKNNKIKNTTKIKK